MTETAITTDINTVFSEDEYEALQALCDKEMRSLPEQVRYMVVQELKKRHLLKPKKERPENVVNRMTDIAHVTSRDGHYWFSGRVYTDDDPDWEFFSHHGIVRVSGAKIINGEKSPAWIECRGKKLSPADFAGQWWGPVSN